MKLNIRKPVLALLAFAGTACTANYLDINSNPYEVDEDQMQADGYIIGATLNALSGTVVSTNVNTAQFTDCLLGGPMGGYFSTSGDFANTIANFNAKDDWTKVFMTAKEVIPTLFTNLRELERITKDPVTLAIAEVIKVCAMHRVTDTYGPIPYSRIAEGGKIQVPYDSQEAVYDKMFEELNHAIGVLTANRTGGIAPSADYIFGGSAEKWCKLANSLKLRLAMRIVYANPEKAREMAQTAVSNEVGVMTSNADNACMSVFGEKGNPIYVAVKYNQVTHADGAACQTGGDTHAAADIVCYMNAYGDPRRPSYFIKSEWAGADYAGLRRGIVIPDLGTVGHKYSGVNVTLASPLYWMNAAEVAFLRAEAKAVFGFDMGGEARDFYNEGIRLSFEQWNASGYAAYVAQADPVQVTYTDPAGTNTYGATLTTLPVAWNDQADPAEMQERILIQKWIANWQLGNEAWADYRRTGFPRLIPATAEGNKSGGVVKSELGARRMPYPQDEYTNNGENIQAAVSTLLKGKDDMATRIWWDCNPAIN